MIKPKGTREMVQHMRKDIEKIKGSVQATHQNLVRMIFRDMVAYTPQWSGELAMHWGIEVHGARSPAPYSLKNPAYERRVAENRRDPEPFQMGADPAVSMTVARELAKIKTIKYNSKVKIVNRMPYALEVQRGVGPFGKPIRDVNRLAAFGGVAMMDYIDMKYSNLRQIKKAVR